MSYLGVLEAVRARLLGNDPKFVPSFPVPEVAQKRREEQPLGTVHKKSTIVNAEYNTSDVVPKRIIGFEVPVYEFDVSGRYWAQNYASLTYDVTDFSPRYTEHVENPAGYGGRDAYCFPVAGTSTTVTDGDGNVLGEASDLYRQRPVEAPFDITIEVRAYAKDKVQATLLVDYVYTRMGTRGFLRVPYRDGSYRSWDMIHQDYQDLDKREAVRAGTPGLEREYAKVWTYVIEGYLDNTDSTQLVHRTQQRIIQLSSDMEDC